MFEKIVNFSITNRWLVMLAVLGIVLLGVYNFNRLPIDAVPDITNVQVQINTDAPGYSPLEVEQFITYPLETALAGLPRLDYTRSLSRYGLSQITVVFKETTNIYFARQLIGERLGAALRQLPEGVETEIGPVSTGLGEIFMYSVEAEKDAVKLDGTAYTPTDLRTIHDWTIRPQLRNVLGVNEVNAIGGFEKQIHITPNPEKLIAYRLALHDIVTALTDNNQNIGAGYIEKNGEQYLVRVPGQAQNLQNISAIVIGSLDGVPIHIHDVAEVGIGKELRTGAGTINGHETVLGTAMMLIGENSRTVSQRVAAKLVEINKSLPTGVIAKPIYNRTALVEATIKTVRNNLFEGALLVIIVLFLLLGNIRAAIITALVIPLSMLFTITGMVEIKISGNLMSLGALDFGIIVDGAVIIVENCIRRLAAEQKKLGRLLSVRERFAIVRSATIQVRRATMFGELMIMIVYIPIFTLSGVEGKMFHPMALTVIMALLGAMILSVTFVPAAVAIFLRGKISEKENLLVRGAKKIYEPLLKLALSNRILVVLIAACLLLLSGIMATRLGAEFIPSLDEGDIAVQALRTPSTSLSQSVQMQKQLESHLLENIPEIREVFARTGTAEIASDPMPPNISDAYLMLQPRKNWPDSTKEKSHLITEIRSTLAELPGQNFEISQPIQLRFNELLSGVRSDLGVKIFGDDLEVLRATAGQVAALLNATPGAGDVRVEQSTGLPVLTAQIDRIALSRYGITVAEVQEAIEIAIGGKKAGVIYDGDKRFDLVVRFPERLRSDIEAIKLIPVALPSSGKNQPTFIPLENLAHLVLATGPNQISRENGKRRIVVSANVRDRDLGSFVAAVQEKIINADIIPAEYWVTYGGQFERLIAAADRLQIAVPFALALIFILLFVTFNSILDALLVFTGVPLALTGGIVSLWVRDMPFSISAGVGFIALSGISMLNGLVMITFIKSRIADGVPLADAVRDGSIARLRPVLITALVAALGFVPMALANGAGAEVQRPLATVVIGGILSSTALTLFVLPVLFTIFHREKINNSAENI